MTLSQLTPATAQRLLELAEEVATREGVKIYDLEFVGQGRQRTLRVYIDSEKGVSIDDCANVSRGLNLLLDADDIIPDGAYELEVSSPGLERRLKVPWHFQTAVGKVVRIKTHHEVEIPAEAEFKTPPKVKTLEGELVSADDASVVVKMKDLNWKVSLDNIQKANVMFVDSSSQQDKQKKLNKKNKK